MVPTGMGRDLTPVPGLWVQEAGTVICSVEIGSFYSFFFLQGNSEIVLGIVCSNFNLCFLNLWAFVFVLVLALLKNDSNR